MVEERGDAATMDRPAGSRPSASASNPWDGVEADPKAELARLQSFTLWQALRHAASLGEERNALIAADDEGRVRRVTFGELINQAGRLSGGLAELGVARGDRVILWMTNTVEWVVSALAIMRLGATVVPVNTFLKTPEIQYLVHQSGARHAIVIDRFRALDMPGMLVEMCPAAGDMDAPGPIYDPALPDLRNVVLFSRSGGSLACAHDFARLLQPSADALALAERMERAVRPGDLGMIKYTSGSTAFPKGAMLEQGGVVASAILQARRNGVCATDIYCTMMPFFHVAGTIIGLLTTVLNGGCLLFTETFDGPLAAELCNTEKATVFVTILGEEVIKAAMAKGHVLDTMRIGPMYNADARTVMPNITSSFASYGMTEAYGCAAASGYYVNEPLRTNGALLDGNECRIVDPETGEDAPPGVVGEILLRGNFTKAYWNKPEESAAAFRDGWFHSGDLAMRDADGQVTYRGRLKLMIKVGGENVSIEEVERAVTGHEAVSACGAVGVPDVRRREAIRMYVVRHPDSELDEETLRGWLKPRIAHFKVPRDIVFVDALPRLGSGKLDRRTIADWAPPELIQAESAS